MLSGSYRGFFSTQIREGSGRGFSSTRKRIGLLAAPFLGAFCSLIAPKGEGWIVNITSIFGLLSYPTQSAYNMSKFAVRGLTECLWSKLHGTGVEAVCVHPTGIRTNIEKSSRIAKSAGDYEKDMVKKIDNMMIVPAEGCAADILNGLLKGQRRILTGSGARTAHWISRLFPNSYPSLLRQMG